MAEIVLGLGTSHSPQLSVRYPDWDYMRQKDETDPRLDYATLVQRTKRDLTPELTMAKWQERYDACQRAIGVLGDVLRRAEPDVIVVFGDDQHEQFLDDNLPAVAIFHGATVPVQDQHGPELLSLFQSARWLEAERAGWAATRPEYAGAPALAEHLIGALVGDDFDVARTNRLRPEVGIGHAFAFLYRRVLPGGSVPMVPVMLNTYFPPNQPTPRRCYQLGQAVRRAVESWDSDARVAVMASGGLSHVEIDEDLDQTVLDALRSKDGARLGALPREKLRGGTSEILNWVALAGAVEPMAMTLVDYVLTYRSLAGTGCGMTFAYWQ
jgi:3-O-methylgallate 3,4-dioxygenase